MPLSIPACVHHVAHASTQVSDKEKQCPLSWSPFPGINILNCLLGISYSGNLQMGLDFIATGRRCRAGLVTVDSYDSWNRLQSAPLMFDTGKPRLVPGVTGTHRSAQDQKVGSRKLHKLIATVREIADRVWVSRMSGPVLGGRAEMVYIRIE